MDVFSKFTKSLITVSGFTGLCRLAGVGREILLSYYLGASVISDAFIIAFKLPNFLRRFFAEGALNAAFVPEFSGLLAAKKTQSAQALINQIFSWLTFTLLIIVVVTLLWTSSILKFLAPGLGATPERLAYAISFAKILFPYILFIAQAALLAGALNSFDRFAAPAAAPIILNVSAIAALYFSGGSTTVLCYAIVMSGALQFLFLYYFFKREGMSLRLTLPQLSPEVRKVFKLMVPGAISAGVMQINIFIDIVLASLLPKNALSYIYYAERLHNLPVSILGVALGVVLLPNLSKSIANKQSQLTNKLLKDSIITGLAISLPAAVGLAMLCKPIVSVIYGRGRFDLEAIVQTAPTLAAFSFGLPAYILIKIFSTTFFANRNTTTPLKIALIGIASNLVLNLLLIQKFEHQGMAFATACSAWIQAICYVFVLNKYSMIQFDRSFLMQLIKIGLATCTIPLLINYVNGLQFAQILNYEFVKLFIIIGLSISIFSSTYYLLAKIRSKISF